MTNRFLISVAALALVAGTGLANAQGTMGRDSGGAGGQQMQHNAQPSGGAAEHSGAMNKSEKGTVGQAGGSASTKPGAAEDKSSGAMKRNEAAEDKAGAAKGTRSDERAQGQQDKSQDKSKGMSSENTKSGSKDMKAESGEGRDNNMKAEGRTGSSSATVGQAGAGAKLSTEQRTQITTVIRDEHVAPVNNVNFAIAVGTRVPREGIEFHTLPSRVVTIYPEWRDYRYILVRDEIVIIDPNTYEIVAVLNV
jgi:hypothetical protein